jgi:hypothetical protein
MKATELRKGNKFVCMGMVQTVFEIIDNTDRGRIVQEGYENLITCEENKNQYKPIEIQGIFLTEEWLLKFGWEWDIFYQGYFGHNYIMFPNNETGWKISYCKRKHDYIVENIQYIHQLQNLYYFLTGYELTIK